MTEEILKWYKQNKRDLPWRSNKDPYSIWVSEIILQQTQIKTGLLYYSKFLHKYPNVLTLASTTEEEMLNLWQGLGYYNRALNMLKTAKEIASNYNGLFPSTYNILITLKGIGPYTAAAISSICIGEKRAVLDGNVFRVISRLYNIATPINTHKGQIDFQKIADSLLPNQNIGEYNQGIMDFGAIQCTKHKPDCSQCPIRKKCQSFILDIIKNRPVKLKRNKLKTRHLHYFLIYHNKYFYIQKRVNQDIWYKLFELPLIESSEKMTEIKIKNNNYLNVIKGSKITHKYDITHILSHQKLKISFWEIQSIQSIQFNNKWKKINFKQISEHAFPKPIKKYFESKKFKLTI